ncbi:hypothetical protein D3C81_447100 [compost metagenome]
MQARTQAAHRLDSKVGRILDRQQMQFAVSTELATHRIGLLPRTDRDRRIDRQADLFDLGRIFNAAIQDLPQQHQANREKRAQQGAHKHEQGLAWLHRLGCVHFGGIDNPHIANGAGTGHIQLLRLVQHRGVHLIADLQVASQSQQLLLGLRKLLYLPLEAALARLQIPDLTHQRLIGRVITSELAVHLRLLQSQLLDAGFHRDFLIQQPLGLQSKVDRVGTHLVGTQRFLRRIDLAAYVGQLLLDEGQLRRSLSRVPLYVLPDIGLRHLLQKILRQLRICILERQSQYPGVLARLTDGNLLLQVIDNGKVPVAGHLETHARMGADLGHLHGDALPRRNLADLAPHKQVVLLIEQLIAAVVPGDKCQRAINQLTRHVQLENIQLLPTPAESRHAKAGIGKSIRGAPFSLSCEVPTEQGKAVRFDFDIKPQCVDGTSDDRSRSNQRNLGRSLGGARANPQRLGEIRQPRQAWHFRFHLHNRISPVDRSCKQRICRRCNEEPSRNCRDPPLVVDQGSKQLPQIDFIGIVLRRNTGVGGHL